MTNSSKAAPKFESLSKNHNRAAFSCKHPELELYLRHFALQQARRKIAATTVLLVADNETVTAYHTLSASAIHPGSLGSEVSRKYPKYSEGLPATLLGRLAVDSKYVGRGHGRQILMNALEKAFAATAVIASTFLIVRAIDDDAFWFYRKYGFIPFPDDPRRLFLPMDTIAELFV